MPIARFNGSHHFLNYDLAGPADAGASNPRPLTLLFLHGTAGSSADFEPQFDHFRKTMRVVTLDLRGHGQSARPGSGYAIEDFADDLERLVGELGLDRIVVVGHSLGGLIALELASRKPEYLAGIVMIDAAMLIPPPVAAALAPLLDAFRGPGYREALQGFAAQFFFAPTDDPDRRKTTLESLGRFPQETFVEIWEKQGAFDAEAAARRAEVPGLYIHASVPVDLGRLENLYRGIQIGRTVASGHYVQLEEPEQVNAMISAFLRKSLQ